jgi:hypothetical protein
MYCADKISLILRPGETFQFDEELLIKLRSYIDGELPVELLLEN